MSPFCLICGQDVTKGAHSTAGSCLPYGQRGRLAVSAFRLVYPRDKPTLLERCRKELACGVSCTYTSEQIVRMLEMEK